MRALANENASLGDPPMTVSRSPVPAPGRMISDPQVPLVEAAAGRYSEAFLSGIDAALRVQPRDRPQDVAQFRDALGLGALQSDESPREHGGRPGEPVSRTGRAPAGLADPDRRSAPRAPESTTSLRLRIPRRRVRQGESITC